MANYTLSNLPQSFQAGDTITVSYTGSSQSFTFKKDGVYKIKCTGAVGGIRLNQGSYGGLSGTVTGTLSPQSDITYYLFVGGKGSNSNSQSVDGSSSAGATGGYNGGGRAGGSAGAGGGGCSAVCSSSSMVNTNCILIGAGGGGSFTEGLANACARGVGTTTNVTSTYVGASGSYGSSGSYPYDTHGGGGGYYGGQSIASDDAQYAYGGVNFINTNVLSSTSESFGDTTGNGSIIITIITPPKNTKMFLKINSTTWTEI